MITMIYTWFLLSCERNSNSQSAYRKRDVRVPADSSPDCLLSRTTRKDSGHSNRRPLANQEILSGPRRSAPRQARPTNSVSGRRRSGPAGSLSNIFKENRLQYPAVTRPNSAAASRGAVCFLLSEVVLPRLGVLDLRIIGSVAWVSLPITSIGLNRFAVCGGLRLR